MSEEVKEAIEGLVKGTEGSDPKKAFLLGFKNGVVVGKMTPQEAEKDAEPG